MTWYMGVKMALQAVSGARIRGGRYFLNIAIPAPLRGFYEGKATLNTAIGTADPRTATQAVITAKADLIARQRDLDAHANQSALVAALPIDQRKVFDDAGGLEGLLRAYDASKTGLAFGEGDIPRDDTISDLEADIRGAEDRAARKILTAHARTEAKSLNRLGRKVAVPGGDFETIADVAKTFVSAKSWTIQNSESMDYTMRRWREFHGDVPLAELTREHLWQFDEAAKGLPKTNTLVVRRQPMKAAIATAKRENLELVGYKVRERMVLHLKAVMSWGLNKGLIRLPADPWAGYKIDKPKTTNAAKKKANVQPFTPAESKLILKKAGTFAPDTLDYWAPHVAAYTGARREEIGQLLVSDVLTLAGVPCLSITDDDPEQKVKNQHGVRKVPVAPALLKMGFLQFVETRRQAGGKYLFLEVKGRTTKTKREMSPNARGRLTESYGMRFNRNILEALEMKKPGQGIHALRHSWTDAARRAGIDKEIRRMIAGRLDGEDATEAGYGGADLIAEKLAALTAIEPFVTA
jgi:integrase